MTAMVSESKVTFCILTFGKTPWLEKTLQSIRQFCDTEFTVKLLSQGDPDPELTEFLKKLDDKRIEVLISKTNIGCDGGRKFLAKQVSTPFVMMLDDDMYLTKGAIPAALDILRKERTVGAVSMPQYDPQGQLISPGGRNLSTRNGVIEVSRPILDSAIPWIEIQHIDGGAMFFRTEMRDYFTWDDNSGFLQDLDKSLQILRTGKWKQAIATGGRLIHDRSWVGKRPKYEQARFNGLTLHRNYEYFRKKWGYRLTMRTHLLYEVIYPAVKITHFPITTSRMDSVTRKGSILKRTPRGLMDNRSVRA